jgi:hypothetical protein
VGKIIETDLLFPKSVAQCRLNYFDTNFGGTKFWRDKMNELKKLQRLGSTFATQWCKEDQLVIDHNAPHSQTKQRKYFCIVFFYYFGLNCRPTQALRVNRISNLKK